MTNKRTRVSSILFGISLLVSCASVADNCQNIDGLIKSHGVTDNTARPPSPDKSFEQWKNTVRQEALSQGIGGNVFDEAFSGLTPDSNIISNTQKQPEVVEPVWTYIEKRVTPENIAEGKKLIKQYRKVTQRIYQRYQVDTPLLFAFLSIESSYGANVGDKSVIRSLATLDYYNYRREFNRQNLISALRIIQNGDVKPQQIKGSWAGAMGIPQFIPVSYLKYAVDFDGDNHPDIWRSFPDSLASVANYMQKVRWKAGVPWGFEVSLPTDFNYALSGMGSKKSIADWLALGVKVVAPKESLSLSSENASLLLPVGYSGPAFLVTDNFRAILRYNNDISYALTVGLLSDNYQRDTPILKRWPLQETPLTRKELLALQILLQEKQLYKGAIDGNIGSGTTQAVRAYQQQKRVPADGYADHALFDSLLCHE